jgi:uncharacterized protein
MAGLTNLFSSRDRVYNELFATFADIAVKSAKELEQLLEHFPEGSKERLKALQVLENEGDSTLHQIRSHLNQSFVTPIDREDILELGSAFDDVIDFTEEAADYLGLYGIEAPMEQAQHLATILRQATEQLQAAVPCVRDFSDASTFIHEVHRLENEGDRVSRHAVASLFRDGIDPMVVIRWKDIFERLEQAIDACEHVADVIDEIIVKND